MENKIKLEHPIIVKTDNGSDISCNEISLGRFKVKHLKLLPKDFASKSKKGDVEVSVLIPLIAGLTNLKEEEVDEIDIEDLYKIVDQLQDFFGDTLDTTGN